MKFVGVLILCFIEIQSTQIRDKATVKRQTVKTSESLSGERVFGVASLQTRSPPGRPWRSRDFLGPGQCPQFHLQLTVATADPDYQRILNSASH